MAIKDNLQPFWGFNVQGITKDDGSANDAFISSLQSELDKTELDLYSSKLETYLDTANGRWLDYWGRWLGLHRDNRSDDDYRTALINHVLHERNTISALTKALTDFLKINQDHIYIYEPWRDMFVWNASHYNTHKFFTDPYYRYAVIDIQIEGPYSEIVNEIINLFRPAGVYWVVTSLVNVINNTAPILDLSLPTTQIIESSDTDYANFTQTNSAYLNSKLDLATYVGDPFNYNKDNLNAGKQYATSNSSHNPVVYIGSNKEEYDTINDPTGGDPNLLSNSDQQFTNNTGVMAEFLVIPFNLNDIFDKYGADRDYTVSFDLSSKDPSKVNSIRSYPNPGTPNPDKYMFNLVEHKNVTTTPKRYSRIIHPTLNDATINKTNLVFYGQYNTGNIPIVNRIKITLGNDSNTSWSPSPSDNIYDSWLQDKRLEYYSTTVETVDWGTNLLTGTDSHTFTGTGSWSQGDLSNETTDDLTTLFKGLEGQTVTMSVDYKYSGFVAGSGHNQLGCNIQVDADTTIWPGAWYFPKNDSGSGRISTTFVVPENIKRIEFASGFVEFSGSGTGTLSHLKLEKGSIATPWSPNPSDSTYASWLQTKQQAELAITSQNLKQQLGNQITTQPTLISSIDSQANSFTVDQTQTSLLGGVDLLGYLTVYKQAVKSDSQTAKQFILANLANSNTQRLELVLQNQANIDLTQDVRLELYDYNLHLWIKPIIEYEVHSDYTIFKVSLSSIAPYLSDGGNFMFQVWPTVANITNLSVNYLGYLFNAPSDIITLANSDETFTMETD